MAREINRGPDVWAQVETDHLSPEMRRLADEAKAELIGLQHNKTFRSSPYESGKINPRHCVIDTVQLLQLGIVRRIKVHDSLFSHRSRNQEFLVPILLVQQR